MFDIGFWELVLLFGLGLMVLGPERLPQVAAKVGRWAGQARNMARNLSNQFREELEPVQSSVNKIKNSVDEVGNSIKTPAKDWSAKRPELEPSDAAKESASSTDTSENA
ncbi:MAG: Sec-independent protein translocase protein TatB [Gammaproteobacteria bacterium]